MQTANLKRQIEALPGGQFTQCWTCVEEIDAALGRAEGTALLALEFVRVRHAEQVADLVVMQQAHIVKLQEDALRNAQDHYDLVASAHDTSNALAKAVRKIARLKKKSK